MNIALSVAQGLEVTGLSKSFLGVPALRDVSFTARRGEILALLGQNGAGKSTLVKILSGVYLADSGQIHLDGREISPRTPIEAERIGVGLVHQELSVIPGLTVAANISLGRERGAWWRGVDDRAALDEARKALANLGANVDPRRRMSELSVSDQQVCEIAKVAARDSSVVIFDEPTTALTTTERERLFAVMDRMRERGHVVIFVTHFLEEALRMADRCVVLRDGRLVADRAAAELDEQMIVELMINEKMEELFTHTRDRVPGEVALELRGLAGGPVKPIDLKVRYGEVVGLSGLIGAGRSELVRMVYGADSATSGSVCLDGRTYDHPSPRNSVRAGIALVSEDRRVDGLTLDKSVAFNISLSAVAAGSRTLARRGVLQRQAERSLAEEMRGRVRLRCRTIDQVVAYLSGGNQQKVAFARTLATNSRVYLFDEPTKGVDVGAKAEIYRMIDNLANDGAAVLIVSSYNPELLGICDRIIVMSRGQMVAEFGPDATEAELALAQQGMVRDAAHH